MKQCSKCGLMSPDEDVYCNGCGTKLKAVQPPVQTKRKKWILPALCGAAVLLGVGLFLILWLCGLIDW